MDNTPKLFSAGIVINYCADDGVSSTEMFNSGRSTPAEVISNAAQELGRLSVLFGSPAETKQQFETGQQSAVEYLAEYAKPGAV